MPYGPLIIAACALAVAASCSLYMQIARTRPSKPVIFCSIAGTIVSLLAITVALVY
jgi:hypothetical protein